MRLLDYLYNLSVGRDFLRYEEVKCSSTNI